MIERQMNKMDIYYAAYARYRSRVNPLMLRIFDERLAEFKKTLKEYPVKPMKHKVAWLTVRQELLKYKLNRGLVIRLDLDSQEDRHNKIVEFLEAT